jgi:hypothetical protein
MFNLSNYIPANYLPQFINQEPIRNNPAMELRIAAATNSVNEELNITNKEITGDLLIISINQEITQAKLNIEKESKNLSQNDKKIINLLKETLTETFTNSYYMIQKTIQKKQITIEDRVDIEKQKHNLEELNKYCETIYDKYK